LTGHPKLVIIFLRVKKECEMKKAFWVVKIILAAALSLGILHAQTSTWVRAIGGGDKDEGRAIIQTPTGYLVAGLTRSGGAGQDDAFIMSLDVLGMPVWTRAYGGNAIDNAQDLIRTADGNYIFAGATRSMGVGQSDAFVCKIDIAGTVIWASAAGTTTLSEVANAVCECSDGSVIIAGTQVVAARNEIMVAKLNAAGGLLWMRVIQGANNDEAHAIVQASDGNYIVTGFTNTWGAGGDDAFILKFDPNGNLLWMRVFGGPSTERGTSLAKLADGGIIVGGLVESWGNGSRDFMIAKFDVNGIYQWSNALGGPNYDEGIAIDQTLDGGYAIVGNRQDPGNAWSVVSAKLDAVGNLLWGNYVGGPNFENGEGITATSDTGYAWAGYSNSWGFGGNEALVAKFTIDGDNCWGTPWNPGVVPFMPNIVSVSPTVSNTGAWQNINPIVTIMTFQEYEVCVLYEDVGEEGACPGHGLEFTGTRLVFWLPGTRPVTLSIYDPAGRVVARPMNGLLLGPGRHSLTLDDLAPGVYFARLDSGEEALTCRFVTR
jgi:hypothetical protein